MTAEMAKMKLPVQTQPSATLNFLFLHAESQTTKAVIPT